MPKKKMTDVTTGTKIVKTRVGKGIENDIEGKFQNEAEMMPGEMAVIKVRRGDLGIRKGEAEAQDDIMAMTGMKGEGVLWLLGAARRLGDLRWVFLSIGYVI